MMMTSSNTALFFCPLASGSKGNSIYLETAQTRILFDAGISLKALQEKLTSIGRSVHQLDAIVISHEHHDHIAGLKAITSKHGIPLFTNHPTAEAIVSHLKGDCPQFHIFSTGEPFEWKDIEINPFSVPHDGVEPVAFTIQTGKYKIGLCTDLGFVTSSVRNNLKGCDILYIEANHKPEMVHASSRPDTYKKRVLSRQGHLSNESSAALIADIADDNLVQIYLAHLSAECNTKAIAESTVRSFLKEQGIRSIPIDIAHQDIVSKSTELK